jgi:hypothetical protein
MMAEDGRAGRPRLLIVTGSTLRAEEVDRPLAYYMKQQIEAHASAQSACPIRVIADFRWLHDDDLQEIPTISIGGPGVNLLAHHWLEDLPVSLAVDEQYYIQMDPELDELRASVWGMDNATTQIAVSAFLQRFLSPFLARSADEADLLASGELDDDEESESENDG